MALSDRNLAGDRMDVGGERDEEDEETGGESEGRKALKNSSSTCVGSSAQCKL